MNHSLIILLHFHVIYALEVVYIYRASSMDRLYNGESLYNPILGDIISVV